MIRNATLLVLLALTAATLSAQHTWTGATSIDWNTASNWNPATVPTAMDDVVIPDTSTLPNAPTLAAGAVCDDLTIQSAGVLNGGAGTLNMTGNWTKTGTYNAGTAVITMSGTTDTSIDGSGTNTFYRLIISKDTRTRTVDLNTPLSITYNVLSATNPGIQPLTGTLRNNGNNVSVPSAYTGGSVTGAGEFHISGGTCIFNYIYQNGTLKFFLISGGDVTITNTHLIYNFGNLFNMTGGTLTYTGTGIASLALSSNNGLTGGWQATGGTATFSGGITLGATNDTFMATGTSVVRFVGNTSAAASFQNSTASGTRNVQVNDLRVEKTAPAIMTIGTSSTGQLTSSLGIGTLTINAGANANLNITNWSTGNGWVIGDIVNSGTLSISASLVTVTGNITSSGALTATGNIALAGNLANTGTFSATAGSLSLIGTSASTLSGTNSFATLRCEVPSKQVNFTAGTTTTVNTALLLEGLPGALLLLRSTASGTQWNLNNVGTVTADYVDVQDSNAAAAITAGGSTNSGNNVNWNFGGTPSGHVWTGAVSTDWGTAGNWNPATVPTTTTNVLIPATGALPFAPTLAATSDCRNLIIETGAVVNGGTATTLNVHGSWSNSGTFNAATSIVFMTGANASAIAGTSTSTFNRLIISKDARTTEVSMLSPVTVTFVNASNTTPGLDIRRGLLRNNGNNLSVAASFTGSTSPALGDLHISGGTCVFANIYQISQLKQFTMTGGTVTVSGTHSVANSGGRFDMSGGTLTYDGTGTNIYCYGNAGGWGWFATAGTIRLRGVIQVASTSAVIRATGTALIELFGTTASTHTLHTTSASIQDIFLQNVHVMKTAVVTTTFNASTGQQNTNFGIGSLVVNASNTVVFNTVNFGAGFRWEFGSVTNAGTVTINATPVAFSGVIANTGTFNLNATEVSTSGSITSTGTFTASASSTVTLTGTAASTLSGNLSFNILQCTVPGRRINFGAGGTLTINGMLFFEGSTGSEIELRSTASGTQWNLQPTGAIVARYCDVQDGNAASTVYAQPGGVDSGNNTNWVFTGGVGIVVTTGPLQPTWANDVSGLVSGTFYVENNTASANTINSVTLLASGTGNDSTAYSEVALYMDHPTSGTQGSFDAADTLYGAAATAFPADNGSLVFAASQSIPAASSVNFFVVVKFNGTTLASPNQTFRTRVSALSLASGTIIGAPTADMPGFTMQQPVLTLTYPTTTARPIAVTYTGPGADGFLFQRFLVTNNSPLTIPLTQFALQAGTSSTTTAPLTVFTSLELFEDTNNSGAWERAHDSQISTTRTSWTATQTFNTASHFIGPNEAKTYLVVVKLNGPGATAGQYWCAPTNWLGTGATYAGLGSGYYVMTIANAGLYVTATPGTAVEVGGSDNVLREAGTFVVHNNSAATSVTLNSITLQASGTGFDNNGYSQVSIYRDSNASGGWDGADTLAATAITAFSADNGTALFTLTTPLVIAGAASERFFVVVRMNGATTPQPQHTFKTRVSAIASSVASDGSGLQSAFMEGISILGNRLTLAATIGSASQVLASSQGTGGNGVQAGVFTVTNTGLGTTDLLTLTLRAAGTGNDSTAFSEVAIYRDSASGSVGSFDFANDVLIGSAAAGFAADNGTIVFNVQPAEQSFALSQARTYFVVVKLNGTATPAQTFQFQIEAVTVASGAYGEGLPTSTMAGLVVTTPFSASATAGSAVGVLANSTGTGGNGIQAGVFTVACSSGGAADLQSITITASGTGNDNTAYSEVAIYRDSASGTVGSFDFANDILVATAATAFPSDNGALTFNVFVAQQAFAASESRTFFVVVKMAGTATAGQTFMYQLTGLVTSPSGVTGLPTLIMAGLTISTPFSATATIGSAQQVYGNATGTGGNGVQAGLFTVTCNAGGSADLLSLTITSSGSGHDANDFSEVAIYRDSASGTVGSYDSANDILIATAASAFPSDNGALTFNVFSAQQAFTAAEARTFFIVVKLSGSANAGNTFQFSLTGITSTPSGVTGVPTAVMAGLTVVAPFAISATAGTAAGVYAGAQGTGGNGVQAGVFTVTNGAGGVASLNTITITASGTGDDATDYSEVAVYRDGASGSVGSFDFANDTLIGSAVTAFSANNGTATFTVQGAQQAFAASEARTYFIVVKLSGTASLAETFQYSVTAITSSPSGATGLPSTVMNGLVIAAEFAVSATVGTAQGVFANDTGSGGNGIQAGVFTIQAGSAGAASLLSMTITASGTGNDSTAYSEVAVYRDSATGTTGAFDFANDVLIGTAVGAFPADNGALTFTVQSGQQAFAASETRTYFVVVKLNATASTGHTFQYSVTALSPAASGLPSSVMAGLSIDAPTFTIADTSSATQGTGYAGTGGHVVQSFTVDYPAGQNNTLTSITFTGTAAAGGVLTTDVTQVDLYRDDNSNGVYDAGVDVLVNSQAAFGGTNQVTFTLTGAESQFAAGDNREYFVVLEFSINTVHLAEFATQLTAASGAATGTVIAGTPAPTAGATAGLVVNANSLFITLIGPGAATTVNSNSQGPGNIGHVLWEGTLATQAFAWTVTALEFEGTGTANHNTAYSTLALYVDTNANNTFDAADQLAVATAGTSFNATNDYTATLLNTAFPATSTRRFFLVGRLAGTATFGQTLNARLTGVQATPPSGGQVAGDLNVDSTALIIDAAAVTVGNGPTPPAAATLKAGTAQAHVMARFRFTATNSNVTVTSMTLTTAGSGNWVADMSATNGVELWEDNGDGVFNAGTDSLIFSGPGGATVNATLTTSLQIANASSKDVWVRVNLLATGGIGAATPITYSISIANAANVQAGTVTPLLGTPLPQSTTLSVVDFFVTTFTPAGDLPAGGAAITIVGSGFVAPLTVTIGGVLCAGSPVITGGTQVTGLIAPPGSGSSQPIVITSGALAPQTLTQTFTYSGVGSVGGGGGGGGGGGCAVGLGGSALLALIAPALVLLRRRRKS